MNHYYRAIISQDLMTKTILTIVFMTTILLTAGIAASTNLIGDAEAAMKASGTHNQATGSKKVCGDKMCSEYPGGRAEYEALKSKATKAIGEKIAELKKPGTASDKKYTTESQTLKDQLETILQKIEQGMRLSAGEIQIAKKAMMESTAEETKAETYHGDTSQQEGAPGSTGKSAFGQVVSDTITSGQDPGVGHEGHQLAVILAPSDNVYVGKLTFSASENVQYVTLHGPLGPGDDNGQPIWSPDGGETKFALTLIDNELKSGGWFFAGNALALHTMHDTPFTATYSVVYSEIAPGEYPKGTVSTGTVQSMQDPGLGHEEHSLALILPPRDIPYQGGVIAYSASENVQLVAVIGPLAEDEIQGQTIWTPDGETKYALTLIEGSDMGVWNTFSGNALALHTMNPDGFTASYTLAGLH
jgi:hypothetical protein